VLLLDSGRPIGSYTRFAKYLALPNVTTEPRKWLDFLRELAAALGTPGVLISTTDAHQVLISRNLAELGPLYRMLVPDADTLDSIVDKRKQYEWSARAGVPIPNTFFPQSDGEKQAVARETEYPCILKPRKAHLGRERIGGKKVVVVRSYDEMMRWFDALGSDPTFMVQEIIPGGDSSLFGYLGLWSRDSSELAWLTKQKLRQFPPRFGDGSHQRTVDVPEVAELSRFLLGKLGYRGFVGIEFKRDPRDGRYKLIEINARTVSGNQLAISAGVDFPWLGFRYLVDGTPPPTRQFSPHVQFVNEAWDVRAFLALYRTREITCTSWARSVVASKARALGAWDDPKPLAMSACRMSMSALRQAGRDVDD